ncbi:Histone deacetylase complex subunit [Microbotryomycetes sp. JL221]|nr:Histone deacetylase complex subunit [Microbotryomycetes sp. JL221]
MTGKKKGRTPRSSASASASPSFSAATLPTSTEQANTAVTSLNQLIDQGSANAADTAIPPDGFAHEAAQGSVTGQVEPKTEDSDSALVEPGHASIQTGDDAADDAQRRKQVSDDPAFGIRISPTPTPPPLDADILARPKAAKPAKRAEQQEVEDEAAPAPEKRPARARGANGKKLVDGPDEYEDEEVVEAPFEEPEDDGITRCVCGDDSELEPAAHRHLRESDQLQPTDEELSSGLMIECDTCKCWQHGPCVGLYNEAECPDRYFCEQCKPTWHGMGGVLKKTYRKQTVPAREPSAPAAQRNNKPRESADASMIQAYIESRIPASAGSLVNDKIEHDAVEEGSRSPSPPTSRAKAKDPPKKRNTMNSRDAAYDRAIALSLMEATNPAMTSLPAPVAGKGKMSKLKTSRATAEPETAPGGGDEQDEGLDEARDSKRRKLSHDPRNHEGDEDQAEGAHKADDDLEDAIDALENDTAIDSAAPVAAAPTPARGKHPNQYTYRPKNGAPTAKARASPVKRIKDVGGAHNGEGSRGNFGSGSSHRRDAVSEGGWGMPDHLKHLIHLLPSPQPRPLIVAAPIGSSLSSNGQDQMLYSTPTRVKFPHKRMTLPEMKKRARHMLDYLSKVQLDMSEKDKRNEVLRQSAEAVLAVQKEEADAERAALAAQDQEVEQDGDEAMLDAANDDVGLSAGRTRRKGAGQLAAATAQAEAEALAERQQQEKSKVETVAMIDALVKETYAFQEKYFGQTVAAAD